ncbi:MAG: NAD-dependent epimerase/dehydratase family protein [Elusimicrobia bacterium]|nr:NAD-dependent epimerase/dehydratase family protein [Elusimicrobiota bacterium]
MFKGKKVLVAGGTGLIGIPLVEMLLDQGAQVRIVSLDDPSRANPKAEFEQLDLRSLDNCLKACDGMDYVMNLLCTKGSPAVTKTHPASFFTPMILFNTCLLEAARQNKVKGYLFTSTIGVYAPAEVFYEDEVWKTFPSLNDRFAGWAKRMGELQVEAYKIEYNWKNITIVRPANVYGPYDNFDSINAMVVPSLIKRAVNCENPMVIWGDGSSERDFVHAEDVARGMLLAVERAPGQILNLGSGRGFPIKELVETIVDQLAVKPKVVWDTAKPAGDKKRIMDISRARAIGFEPQIPLAEGIRNTMDWYKKNKDQTGKRYDVFNAPI